MICGAPADSTGEADSHALAAAASTSSAHATRLPSCPCTMKARPSTSSAAPPVSTLSVALRAPSEEVYATLVHGSTVTSPA